MLSSQDPCIQFGWQLAVSAGPAQGLCPFRSACPWTVSHPGVSFSSCFHCNTPILVSVLSVTIIDLLLHTVRVRMNHPAANASVASYYVSHLTHSPLSSRVLNEFILKNPNLESKKDQRELQVISLWTRHPSQCFTLHQSPLLTLLSRWLLIHITFRCLIWIVLGFLAFLVFRTSLTRSWRPLGRSQALLWSKPLGWGGTWRWRRLPR